MIDYSAIIKVLHSDNYVDKTDCIESFLCHSYISLTGCTGTGSSLFLRTLACFLDETIDTRDVFHNLRIGQNNSFSKEINSYRVVLLDFSDFNARSFESAMEYIKEKMAWTYKCFYKVVEHNEHDMFFDYRTFELALDVIEKKASERVLKDSLRNLLLKLRGYESDRKGQKLALLIDNMVLLEIVAADNNYEAEMSRFLESFIVADVYKYCDVFLQISDSEVENKNYYWSFCKKYMVHSYFSVSSADVRSQYYNLIVATDEQFPFQYAVISVEQTDWNSLIAEGRIRVQKAIAEEEFKRQENIRREKLKYAKSLSPNIPLFSPNLGIRKKVLDKMSPQYARLNSLIKDIYERFYPKFDTVSIYNYLQNLNTEEHIICDTNSLQTILEQLPKGNPKWAGKGLTNRWGYWMQVLYVLADDTMRSTPSKPENIKVYAFLKAGDIQQVFVDSLRYLLQNAENAFGAKLSTCSRSDQMCYWLSKNDFRHLENFFMPRFEDMEKSMPFLAYKGKLGISREFFGYDDSHNSTQAHIIADYLKTVNDILDIDLEEMYNNYIAKWNADIYDENCYCGFKYNSAQSFVVIMDTLDAILSNKDITDDSLLMSDNCKLWHILAKSHCWADVNESWNGV